MVESPTAGVEDRMWCVVCGVWGGDIGGLGSQGVVASARKKLFNCIQWREGGRKG